MIKCLVQFLYYESQLKSGVKKFKALRCENCPVRENCTKKVKEENEVHSKEKDTIQ